MKPILYILVEGIFSSGASRWIYLLQAKLRLLDIGCVALPQLSGLLANWFDWNRVGNICQALDVYCDTTDVILVAHSNGCKRALIALQKTGKPVRNLFLLAAACSEDCRKNGINKLLALHPDLQIYLGVSSNDETLSTANTWLGHAFGFDDLGRVGAKYLDKRFVDRVHIISRDSFGHCDWTSQENLLEILSPVGQCRAR
jgi:predicted alpha/beta hydrolase family esterase